MSSSRGHLPRLIGSLKIISVCMTRFLPTSLAEKYDLDIPKYPGVDQVVELTSRVSTDKVSEAKRRLEQLFRETEHVDVAIATNMISVGLDIMRLGLMVVFGQPKTSSEYIQATSRVGRDHEKPGLVVTILNVHRPRDRSHYERFAAFHESFYRSVEATSVTPFSPVWRSSRAPSSASTAKRPGRSSTASLPPLTGTTRRTMPLPAGSSRSSARIGGMAASSGQHTVS